MTEAEWLTCDDPEQMLEFVKQPSIAESIGILKEMRKERLFGCACCWLVEDLFADARCVEALQVAERLADGVGDAEEQETFSGSFTRLRWSNGKRMEMSQPGS